MSLRNKQFTVHVCNQLHWQQLKGASILSWGAAPQVLKLKIIIWKILEYTKYPLNTVLLMGGHVPLVVVILKHFTLYPSSMVKELSNGTQQVPLGTFT